MISAWEIYLVLQLDSIKEVLGAIWWLSTIGAGLLMLVAFIFCDEFELLKKFINKRAVTFIFVPWMTVSFLNALLPSSSTAAAMFVIPKIANNQSIQKEAADLYGLAKQALTEAIKPDDEPKK